MQREFQEPLSLSNVGEGQLEKMFQDLYPRLLSQLKDKEKATVTIKLEFQKIEETDTMYGVTFSITPKMPAKQKKSVCQLNNEGKLQTETPPQESQQSELRLFQGGNDK